MRCVQDVISGDLHATCVHPATPRTLVPLQKGTHCAYVTSLVCVGVRGALLTAHLSLHFATSQQKPRAPACRVTTTRPNL